MGVRTLCQRIRFVNVARQLSEQREAQREAVQVARQGQAGAQVEDGQDEGQAVTQSAGQGVAGAQGEDGQGEGQVGEDAGQGDGQEQEPGANPEVAERGSKELSIIKEVLSTGRVTHKFLVGYDR